MRLFVSVFFALFLVSASAALAANYDIKHMTPEIEQALESRKARYAALTELKALQVLGENNQGYVEVLKASANGQNLAGAENADRRIIYTAIVRQNNLGPAGLGQVEAVFADVRRQKAASGHKIQTVAGGWITK